MEMRIIRFLVLFLLCNLLNSCSQRRAIPMPESNLLSQVNYDLLDISILKKLDNVSDSGTLYGKILNQSDTLQWIFTNKKFSKIWLKKLVDENFLEKLCKTIKKAEMHGLAPEFYHGNDLNAALWRLKEGKFDSGSKVPYDSLAMLVLESTDACIGLYHDLHCGRVGQDYSGSVDVLPRRLCGNLHALVMNDSTESALVASFPNFEPYNTLLKEYTRLLKYHGVELHGISASKKKIKQGDTLANADLRAILTQLQLFGFGNWPDSVLSKATVYTNEYADQVKRFKWSRGLQISATIDEELLHCLSISREDMMLKLKASLDRWRSLGNVKENTRIWVNIAANRVLAWKEDTLKVDMKICSGQNRDKKYYKLLAKSKEKDAKMLPPDNLETPLLKATLTHFVVNPTWFVPRNIAVKEILPLIKVNPGVLAKYDYVLKDENGNEIDPFSVDWSSITQRNFPFTIEQLYGKKNSLGAVVIHFPNAYNIYMHDTPEKWVFGLDERHVSHGCLRMEKPFEMIEYLTSFGKKDNFDKVLIAAGMEPKHDKKLLKEYNMSKKDSIAFEKFKPVENKYFKAEEKIPVYIVYFTSYVSNNGVILYTDDTYARDAKMLKEMNRPRKKMVI